MLLSTSLLLSAAAVSSVQAASSSFPEGVIATGTQGVTNPPVPTIPTTINQTSVARLLSLNSIDDFCLFAPPELCVTHLAHPRNGLILTIFRVQTPLGTPRYGSCHNAFTQWSYRNVFETEEVAWCTQPRNNARLIPDGTITAVTFLKTDFYVQIMGLGDFTKLNIQAGDEGGELDPHGATGAGNPVGGNVTTNIVDGLDEPIAEWMLYISFEQFCVRACTNANSTYSAAFMCWHELDEMGCEFVMPGVYQPAGVFESCEADVAYPPGWYPTATVDGTTQFSTFAQFFTGFFTGADGQTTDYTVGDTITPSTVASIPSSSNCASQSSISNGIALESLTSGAVGTAPPSITLSGSGGVQTGGSGEAASQGGSAAGTSATSSTTSGPNAASRAHIGYSEYAGIVLVALISSMAAIAILH
ncbi:hypothetical protein MSAN_02110100 [Mycena sanguinolenta]|uniref:Uncharacterized protein n=1 Tax=Mycena sanguinolenta TaxID=230812 RepID=A0A8H7CK95_9AGAR|nr:hypothetical protein MSAN_02110100 [Mycena sanguinolenta]